MEAQRPGLELEWYNIASKRGCNSAQDSQEQYATRYLCGLFAFGGNKHLYSSSCSKRAPFGKDKAMELFRVKGHRNNASRNVVTGGVANAPVRSIYQSVVTSISVGDTAALNHRNTTLHTSCANER